MKKDKGRCRRRSDQSAGGLPCAVRQRRFERTHAVVQTCGRRFQRKRQHRHRFRPCQIGTCSVKSRGQTRSRAGKRQRQRRKSRRHQNILCKRRFHGRVHSQTRKEKLYKNRTLIKKISAKRAGIPPPVFDRNTVYRYEFWHFPSHSALFRHSRRFSFSWQTLTATFFFSIGQYFLITEKSSGLFIIANLPFRSFYIILREKKYIPKRNLLKMLDC